MNPDAALAGALFGGTIGIMIGALIVIYYHRGKQEQEADRKASDKQREGGNVTLLGSVAVLGLVLLSLLMPGAVSAQVPTIDIPTDVIFTETNNWITTFAPITAISVGIGIALAILGYIGRTIISSFR